VSAAVPLRLEAPAKLNLSLAVLGRRADEYHELAGVMVLIELADRLLLMPGCSGLRVEGDDAAGVPVAADDNLAWRGLVAGLGAEPELACLTVEKRIPPAAGLGGGSSDAAAAWRLGRRWRGAADAATYAEVEALAEIGADVPFFAASTAAAMVRGIGERVSPIGPAEPPFHVVLVHAPFGLSTAAVFAELRPSEWSAEQPSPRLEAGRNDLLAAVRRLRPEIDDLIAAMVHAGGDPRLTGSGPTLFSLTHDPERADAVAARLVGAGLRVTGTRTRTAPASIEPVEEEP
jgi:4-diphosphocytidyl-2-C-methyl-D-erythritol kinase